MRQDLAPALEYLRNNRENSIGQMRMALSRMAATTRSISDNAMWTSELLMKRDSSDVTDLDGDVETHMRNVTLLVTTNFDIQRKSFDEWRRRVVALNMAIILLEQAD